MILEGDCIERMKELADNSVDSIITDPPYGLSNHTTDDVINCLTAWLQGDKFETTKSGFMSKKWDSWVPGPEVWKECYRILKPGGHMLVFAGTRTQDLMGIAIRLAGFEYRDEIQWVYGCISEDTEILTVNGWEHCRNINLNSPVVTYNINDRSFKLDKPQRIYRYTNKYPAYRIYSDHTDQLVSRDHRCIVEREGGFTFISAQTCKPEEIVPVLEDMSKLWERICNIQPISSYPEPLLFKGMYEEFDTEQSSLQTSSSNGGERRDDGDNVCNLQFKEVDSTVPVKTCQSHYVLQQMQVQMDETRSRTDQSSQNSCIKGKGRLDRRIYEKLFTKYVRRKQPCMERRGDVLQDTWELQGCEICEVPTRVYEYGKEGRICNGTQVDNSLLFGKMFEKIRGSSPYRSRSNQQQDRKLITISIEQDTQIIRRDRVKIEEIEYKGIMWCVSVKDGAFVARRNGKIFITGNSGFPKSQDICKAIDKQAGATREVVATVDKLQSYGYAGNNTYGDWCDQGGKMDISAPATDNAKKWEGFGSCLKPSHEPIILVRKPISEKTIAQNVLKWETGALNIDGCRVEHSDTINFIPRTGPRYSGNAYANGERGVKQDLTYAQHNLGRFPANLILDDSECIVSQFPYTKTGNIKPHVNVGKYSPIAFNASKMCVGSNTGSSGSAARFFYSSKASPSERAGSNHPTMKPLSLMKYLCKLITPPGGTILDCFAGSGSTGLAAQQEGFQYILIEKEPDYIKIINKRLIEGTLNEYTFTQSEGEKIAEKDS